eukprot:scaffold1328_cov375-Pavlova_lutheri.AAC.23
MGHCNVVSSSSKLSTTCYLHGRQSSMHIANMRLRCTTTRASEFSTDHSQVRHMLRHTIPCTPLQDEHRKIDLKTTIHDKRSVSRWWTTSKRFYLTKSAMSIDGSFYNFLCWKWNGSAKLGPSNNMKKMLMKVERLLLRRMN